MTKRLNEIGINKLMLAFGCWLLVINFSSGQVAGDFRTNGNVTFAAAANWQRYNGAAWVAAVAAPVSTDGVITIMAGHTATVTANKTLDQVVVANGGVLTINLGQTFNINNGAGTDLNVSGTINNSGTINPTGTIVFNSSSSYNHTQDNGTIPDATWNTSSNCNITGVTANVPGGLSQFFGNFTWNCAGQTDPDLNINPLETGNGGSVTGDFTLISTGAGSIRLSNNANRILDISGNFNISGGIFHLAIAGGSATVNIGGDFNMTGGTLTETGTSAGIFVFGNGGTTQNFRRTVGSISNNIGFTVSSNVTIDFGTNDFANGGGTFTLSNGATLQTANSTGINGSIQTTSRSLSTSANYTFDGTVPQVTGTFLPANVNNFTVNNLNGITLTNSVTAAGTLNMNSGNIVTGANTFILSNNLSTALNYTAGIIAGRFERFINTTSVNYFFPVGTAAQIQSLTANFVNLTSGSLLVQYITGDPGNSGLPLSDGDGSQITNQFTTGYWSALAKNSLVSTNYNIDLNATGFGPYAINAGTRLMKRTDAGGSWLISGTHSDAVGSVVKRTGMNGIFNAGGGSQFGIGRSGPGILTQPSNRTVCENTGTSFSVTAAGHPTLAYQWYKVPGIPLIEGGRFIGTNLATVNINNVILSDGGSYYCIITDGPGNTVQSNSVSLTVNLLPVPTIAGPTPVCVGITGNVYTTEAGMSNYLWTVSAGGTITAGGGTGNNTVTVTWTTTGAKSVTVNYTNVSGCTATIPATYNVTVNPLPVPTIAGPTPVCVGIAGNVYTTEAGMSNYLWTVSAGGTITAGGGTGNNTVTVTWTTTGAKTVTVNYTNVNGCTATAPTTYNVTVNPLPVPTIAGPNPVCVGITGNVYTTEAGMSNYLWTVSAGGTITAGGGTGNNTVTITWTTTGAKTVTVNYTNGNGCIATAPTTYNVTVNPLPVPTIAGPTPVCVGIAGNVYTTEAGMSNYLWTVSAGGTITAGGGTGNNTVTVTWTTTGAKTVTVNYTNVNGCTATIPATYNVTVNPLPVPTIAGTTPVCVGITGNVYTTEAGMSNYLWTVSAGGTITAGGTGNNTVTVTWTTNGAKTVTVNYTNSNGCTATAPTTYNITVNALPSATAGNNSPICVGIALSLMGGPAGMTTYSWTGPNGFISALQNPLVSASATIAMAGVYTLIVTNVSGCSSTATTTVTVNTLPVALASNNDPVCVGSVLSLSGGPAGMTYSWNGPNAFTSLIQNPTVDANVTLAMAGVYTLTVTNASGCTGTATTTATVAEKPVAIAGPDQELTFVFETQMEAELTPPETGEWSLISGSGHISDLHSPTTSITELATGENKFLWKVGNGSCETSAEVKINVHDIFVPSVITPDGDGKNDYFRISENIGKVKLIIFNRWGNEEYTNSDYKNDWDGRNNKSAELPNDTYFYVLIFENGKIKKGSVLIKR